MAVTKRTRFEVLRRDQHTCQYCGEKAPDVVLQIDHVIPVSLGGDDKPSNLVTACKDCNSGKTSIPPDSPMVQSLSAEAAAYALGMIDKMTRFRADLESLDDYAEEFYGIWDQWTNYHGTYPLPDDHSMSLYRWMRMGLPMRALHLAIDSAMSKQHVRADGKFTYMAGIIRNMLDERQIDLTVTAETTAVMTQGEVHDLRKAWWRNGHDIGESKAVERYETTDFIQQHIDRTHPYYEPNPFDGEPMYLGLVRSNAA